MSTFEELVAGSSPMPFAEKLVRLRAKAKPDPYNPDRAIEDWSGVDEAEIEGFITTSASADLDDAARAETDTSAVLTVPDPTADVRRGDRVRDASGRVWSVEGVPTSETNPFTGWRPTLQCDLEEVLG